MVVRNAGSVTEGVSRKKNVKHRSEEASLAVTLEAPSVLLFEMRRLRNYLPYYLINLT